MTDFSVESGIRIPERELRKAEREVEESIGSVSVSVDDGQPRTGGSNMSGSTGALMGGAGVLDELGDQTDILADIHREIEKAGVSAGGGGGGGGGLLGGGRAAAFGLGSLATGGGGLGLGSLLGGASLTGAAGFGALGIGGAAFLADQYVGEDAEGAAENVSGGMPGMVEHTIGSRLNWEPPEWQGLSGLWEDVDLSPPDDLWPTINPPDWGSVDGDPPAEFEEDEDQQDSFYDRMDDFYTDENAGIQEGLQRMRGHGGGDSGYADPAVLSTEEIQAGTATARQRMRGHAGGDSGYAVPSALTTEEIQAGARTARQRLRETGGGEVGRTDITIQEVRAQLEARNLESELGSALEEMAPEIQREIANMIRDDFAGR